MAVATQASNRPPLFDSHTNTGRRRSLTSMLILSSPRTPSHRSLQDSCSTGSMYSADQTSPQLKGKSSKRGLWLTPQKKRNGTVLHAIAGQPASNLAPLEQNMANSPNAEILNNIRGSASPLKPSISPTEYRKAPQVATEAKASSSRQRESDGSNTRIDSPMIGTYQRGKVHWDPQPNLSKSAFSPDRPETDTHDSPNKCQSAPIEVDLSSYEPPPTTAKTKKPKIQVTIPKNKRPRPMFRKFSKDSDGKSSGKRTSSPDKHSGSSARDLLPKSGALVPAKAAAQLGIISKTPGVPAGMQMASLRTAPPKKDTASRQPPPTAPIGPSPLIAPGQSNRSFTLASIPTQPATSKPKVKLSDDRSLYEIPIPPQQHDPTPPPRPSQDTADGSVESESAVSDGSRLSDASKRTSMTSLDSKDVPDAKMKGIGRPGRTATSVSPPTRSGALQYRTGHQRNASDPQKMGHLANTRGVRLGEQLQERANSVPSPEKRGFDGAPTADKPKRSLDERRPILKRNEFSRRLESPGRKALSLPSPEKNVVQDDVVAKEKTERKVESKQKEKSPKKRDKSKKQSISKTKSLSNLNDKPLPPSPPPSAMAILPDGNKLMEKNVFDEKWELELRRTQSQLSPSKRVQPTPRRSHSQRSQRYHTQRSNNSGLIHARSRSRSRAGSRTKLDQLDRNFINASPKPDQSPVVARNASPTLSQAEHDLETHLTAITESPTYYFDNRFKTPEWEKSREQVQRYSSSDVPPIPLRSPKRTETVPAPLVRKRSSSAPPASPPQRHASVHEVAIERQEQVSADAAEQIIVKIMANLDSLEDLFRTAIIDKGFYRTFKRHELDLMQQVLRNASPAAWEHREFTPPNADEADPEDDLPVEEYTPTTYLECYGQDLQIIGGLKALIVERCSSVLRSSTADALATTDPDVSRRVDSAFWRIWTFCTIFGATKGREDDINGQMDWLRGGVIAHTQTCTHSVMGSESMDLNSVLLAAPLSFAKGNNPGKGLTAEELYDMMELWTCLGALTQGLHGRTAQARQFGIFDGIEVKDGDINGEEALVEEWLHYIMSLGLDATLGIGALAAEPGPDAFELAKEQGWTKWGPPHTPEKGIIRSTFLKEAIGRVYQERIAIAYAATASPIKAVHRKASEDRVAGFKDELRTSKARPTYARLPPSDERPMSDWQGTSSELGFGPPVPPIQDRPHPPIQEHATAPTTGADSSGLLRSDRFGSVATTGTNDTHASPPHDAPGPSSPAPLPATVFGHGGPFGHGGVDASFPSSKPPRQQQPPAGLGITSPSGAPRIDSTIPSSPLDLLMPPTAFFGEPSPMATPGAREVPAVLQLDLGRVEPVGTAERAVQQIRDMGFPEEDAKRALKMTDIGDGLRVDRALEMLLRE